jgi:hypothetical protein
MRTLALVILLVSSAAHAESDDLVRPLEDATSERRVFRHIVVGQVHFPSDRVTWVLYRGRERARLDVFCQNGDRQPTKGIRLDGRELDEAYWREPFLVRYSGTSRDDAYELRREKGATPDKSMCRRAPELLSLRCRSEKVSVRPVGAKLFGVGPDQETKSAVWKPATRTTVRTLRCHLSGDDPETPLEGLAHEWPMVFALPTSAAAGVEWADENSDMNVQAGSYRWIGLGL